MIKIKMIFVITALLILSGCGSYKNISNNQLSSIGEPVGNQGGARIDNENIDDMNEDVEKVPAIGFTLLDGLGNEVSLSDYKGKFVFINFWATWCPYCVEEMPLLQKTYETYNEDLEILAVNVQSSREKSVPEVLKWVEDRGFTFKTIFDMEGSIANAYYVTAYPTTYIVDREGFLIGYVPGKITEDMMDQIIEYIYSEDKN